MPGSFPGIASHSGGLKFFTGRSSGAAPPDMCGIFGILRPDSPLTEDEEIWMRSAQAALAHRGPDGHGIESFLDGRCSLGHTRLAIIDLAGGAQPLFNEDRTIAVICNGEIYNHVELRQQLEARGHRFRTYSDCEVLAHLYEDRGEQLLDDLEGMFAFALLDQKNENLFLARDRFGEKPLYWTPLGHGGGLAFASELKALRGLPAKTWEIDLAAAAQFLAARYIPAPRTFFGDVYKLRSGEKLVVSSAGTRVQKYWDLVFPAKDPSPPASRDGAVEEVRQRLRQAVRLRLRSDVPVGAFLSGGIDSTSIVCAVRELEPGARLHTFCASFDEAPMDEAPFAKIVAQKLETEHTEVKFSERELLAVLDKVIDGFDEPFADASMLPTFAVCRAARQQCKVMLSGDGGDEFFAGYRSFFQYNSWNTVRRFLAVRWLAQSASALRRSGRGANLLGFLGSSDRDLLFPGYDREAILGCFVADLRDRAQEGLLEVERTFAHHARLRYPQSLLEATATAYLPEQILVKVDRTSMMSSLESRAPFLDRSLIEYALRLPLQFNLEQGMGKAVLRRALPEWVPSRIRWRDKRGFTPPMASWLRSTLRQQMEEILQDSATNHTFNLQPVRHKLQQHLAGTDHADYLFRWYVLLRSWTHSKSFSQSTAAQVTR